ncbi:MAG: hypothetical protein J6386_09635 [Candidatus Synoicihabitans palmerolidicus]|nr:hypothetical protein [Candidatus Synoicihabitans palmerolidicus]
MNASLRWRHYLADRDRLIREMASQTFRGRRLLHRHRYTELASLVQGSLQEVSAFAKTFPHARRAANDMWLETRRKTQSNPNLAIIAADRSRLSLLTKWWQAVVRKPELIKNSSDVVGAWNVQALVHITHPNLQSIMNQTQNDQGIWRDVHKRYLIEFRTYAARRKTNIRHSINFPLSSATTPVRFALRGFGQFTLSDVHLTDGVQELRALSPNGRLRRRVVLAQTNHLIDIMNSNRSQNMAEWQRRRQAASAQFFV